ncbi:MAG: TMEM14 family protein [Aulosira sp. ZfuVER01]|nr:TMEM14 family protein [Aulosira sp. ZfuVER01]MDZ8002740.1 TMEM14 family protein [Aulosira sp. DedVER01a]MDZ8054441.1 TMEM14 family protein [Aulosira sp. ZfuCHP01]
MEISIIAALVYGILALIGGIMGYIQANSKVSLLSGVISGLLLIFASFLQLQGQAWGLLVAALVTAVLVVFFCLRLAKTRKFMPSGLMAIVGMVALVLMLNQIVAVN